MIDKSDPGIRTQRSGQFIAVMVKYQVVHGEGVGPHADRSRDVMRPSDRYGGMGGAGGGAVGDGQADAGVAGRCA